MSIDTVNSVYDYVFDIDESCDIVEKFRTHARMIIEENNHISIDDMIDDYVFDLDQRQIETIIYNHGRGKARKIFYKNNKNKIFDYIKKSRYNFDKELVKTIIKDSMGLYDQY